MKFNEFHIVVKNLQIMMDWSFWWDIHQEIYLVLKWVNFTVTVFHVFFRLLCLLYEGKFYSYFQHKFLSLKMLNCLNIFQRSYGRPPRIIHVDANFVPYKPELVTGDDMWELLGKAFFHVFWTECVSLAKLVQE